MATLLFLRWLSLVALLILVQTQVIKLGASGQVFLSYVIAIELALNAMFYFLARFGKHHLACWLVISESIFAVLVVTIKAPIPDVLSACPNWFCIPIVLAGIVLSIEGLGLVGLLITVSFSAVFFFVPAEQSSILLGPAVLLGTVFALTAGGVYLRQRLELLYRGANANAIQSSKLTALGEMAAGIAHEINSPLGAIILNAEMIELKNLRSSTADQQITLRAENIVKIGQRISKIMNGLKAFSRDASADGQELVSVRKIIEGTIVFCGEKFRSYGVELKIDPENLETSILGQEVQLSQTLLNLLNNAYDAVKKVDKHSWVQIKARPNGRFIDIAVSDSGLGIPPEILERIFQPFFTTKGAGKGTGLGLSISKNIIKNHGGDLVYDRSSKNTCFIIRLPVAGQSVSRDEASLPEQ